MVGAESAAGLAVEVLVKEDEVLPVRVGRVPRVLAMQRAWPRCSGEEERGESSRELARDFTERHPMARSGGALHGELITIEVVVALERFDEEIVHRKPDRAPPVRVATKQPGRGLA